MKLILRTVTSPYDDITKGSVLSHQELDTNQINLKGELIYTANSINNVITFQKINGGIIEIPFSGGSGGGTYTNLSATTATLGGIPIGSTFVNQSMTQMFDALLYPYQAPNFTSFTLGISSPREMGDEISTNQTFTWSTSNVPNVSANTISIFGDNLTTLTGLANNGSQGVVFTDVVTRNAADGVGTRSWTIQGRNTKSNTFTTGLSIRWDWKMYVGTSTNTSLTASQITGLTNYNSVKNGFVGSYEMSAGGYKYFCFATTYGTPAKFVNANGGLGIAMFTGYPNIDANGNSYALVSITNSKGQTINYRVYRSFYVLESEITIVVT